MIKYKLRIPYPGDNKLAAIVAVRAVTGRSLKEAHRLVKLGPIEEEGEIELSVLLKDPVPEEQLSSFLGDIKTLREHAVRGGLDVDLDIEMFMSFFNRARTAR